MVRMGRVNPEPLKYREWTIPPNVPFHPLPASLENSRLTSEKDNSDSLPLPPKQ
jgi:hypothetical protein